MSLKPKGFQKKQRDFKKNQRDNIPHPNLHSTLQPLPYRLELPVLIPSSNLDNMFLSSSYSSSGSTISWGLSCNQSILLFTRERYLFITRGILFFTQSELYGICLRLWKHIRLLGSRLHQWNLLDKNICNSLFRKQCYIFKLI